MAGPNDKPPRLPGAVLCFSHLRWRFVFQRPQHLLTRYSAQSNVTFFEEPIFEDRQKPCLEIAIDSSGVRIATPLLPRSFGPQQAVETQRALLDNFLFDQGIEAGEFVSWYYTPMALSFTRHLAPAVTVYDCMDELSAFDGAPPELVAMEQELFTRADVVFAGGQSLYTAKRDQHANVHAFASSIDHEHFQAARLAIGDPEDQAHIPHPRIGFFGVLDERLDRELLRAMADDHPLWHFVLIGPLAKIRPEDLPIAANLHYLGQKDYAELPRYLANWDVAMLPFARNQSTRFISPTKTPEYLAAGKPVVSTPIHDVVHPYGDLGLVSIAGDAIEFGRAIEAALQPPSPDWLPRVDELLARNSWDKTFAAMMQEVSLCHARGAGAQEVETKMLLNDAARGEIGECLTI